MDNYTLEKYTLAQKSLVMVATSLVMVSTSLVTVATSLALLGGHQRRLLHRNVQGQWKFKSMTDLPTYLPLTYQQTDMGRCLRYLRV